MPDWDVHLTDGKDTTLKKCSTGYYDVVVVDSTLEKRDWLDTIKEIRARQIFTPILVISPTYDKRESQLIGLSEGADMCIETPFDISEMVLRIRVLKRRNTNYQSPQISYQGIVLNRPDGKICYGDTSLSVSPIEIEVFRLLTRASTPIHTSLLAEKISEGEDKVVFSAKCLKKKIGLLGCPIKLNIVESKCQLIVA
jgi:two-component system OmpR family response regulator